MEFDEMLDNQNEIENVDTQTTEKNVDEGIELTDTSDVKEELSDENDNPDSTEEKEEVKKTLKELLAENPEYQTELDETIIKPRLARKDREYQRKLSKYQDTENVLRTTLELNEDDDVNLKLRSAYEEQGIKLPEAIKPSLSSHELEILAKSDAQEIIDEGYDVMVDEANRLAEKGYDNLNEREKIVFTTVAEKLTEEKNSRELLKLGAKKELLNDKDFIDFKNKFNSKTPIGEIYSLYNKLQPKKEVRHPGSMKNNNTQSVKDFYTPEEVKRLSPEDWEKPGVWENVMESQRKWEK